MSWIWIIRFFGTSAPAWSGMYFDQTLPEDILSVRQDSEEIEMITGIPDDESHLKIIRNHHFFCFDNLSFLPAGKVNVCVCPEYSIYILFCSSFPKNELSGS